MKTADVPTATRLTACAKLVVHLGGVLAELGAEAELASAARAEASLAAASGDAGARQALDTATRRAAEVAAEVESTRLGLDRARERRAALEAQAEAERVEGVRAELLRVARQRREAALRVEAAIAELGDAWAAFRSPEAELNRLAESVRGPGEPAAFGYGLAAVDLGAAVRDPELRRALGLSLAVPGALRGLVASDPAARWASAAEGATPGPVTPGVPGPGYVDRWAGQRARRNEELAAEAAVEAARSARPRPGPVLSPAAGLGSGPVRVDRPRPVDPRFDLTAVPRAAGGVSPPPPIAAPAVATGGSRVLERLGEPAVVGGGPIRGEAA